MKQIAFLYLFTGAGAVLAGVWCGLQLESWIATNLIFAIAILLTGMGLGVWSCLHVETQLRCEESSHRLYVLQSTARLAALLESPTERPSEQPKQLIRHCVGCGVNIRIEKDKFYVQMRDGNQILACDDCVTEGVVKITTGSTVL